MKALASNPRLLLYSHDSYGLGHFRRNLTIAKRVVERSADASILCVTGQPRPEIFGMPDGIDYVKLPSVTKDEGGDYCANGLHIELDDVTGVRSDILLATAKRFRPGVFLVDHSPGGVGGELLPTLQWLQREMPETATVLGLRDVIDSPERVRSTWAKDATLSIMETFYSHILVYGCPTILDAVSAYQLPEKLAAKLQYTGIVCRCPEHLEGEPDGSQEAGLLVTAGGGGDGVTLLASVLTALAAIPERSRPLTTMVLGPLMPGAERSSLKKFGNSLERVFLLDQVTDMCARFERARAVISMGGYNSVYEALLCCRRLLVYPRTSPRLEQHERAKRLRDLGLVDVLEHDLLRSPELLAARIREVLRSPPNERPLPRLYGGARKAAELLLRLARDGKNQFIEAAEDR